MWLFLQGCMGPGISWAGLHRVGRQSKHTNFGVAMEVKVLLCKCYT